VTTMNSAYVIYGVRIPDMDWQDPRGKVGYFQGGLHDRELTFLVTYRDDVPCGQYYIITAERIHAERKWRKAWDDNLVTVARDLGVTIIDGPGWYFVPSEDR
jgi:hypothetical protein